MVKIRKGTRIKLEETKKKVKEVRRPFVNFINDLEIAEAISYKRLDLFPIFRQTLKDIKLKTLVEGLKEKIIEVKETGTIEKLEIINKSKDTKILIMEGDIVKGGAQNRIINISMILDEDSTVKVPTTCVQQGRWDTFDKPFTKHKYASPILERDLKESVNLKMMESKGLHNYAANQSKIWSSVSYCSSSAGSSSSSGDYTDIYEDKNVQKKMDKYRKAFKNKFPNEDKSLVGVVIVIDNVCKVDICVDNEIFLIHCEGLLEGCFLDAVSSKDDRDSMSAKEVSDFIDGLIKCEVNKFKTPNKNAENLVLKSDKVNGNVLIYNNEVIHLTAFLKR